jgi:transposase-like protein
MVQRMLGPEGISASKLSKEVGIAQPTLSRWLKEAHILPAMDEKKNPTNRSRPPHQWTWEEKLKAVQEALSIPPEELGAFLRRKGLHSSQLEEWRRMVETALRGNRKKAKDSPEKKKIRELEKDLRLKEKALAEVTALLTLKKKLQVLLGEEGTEPPMKNGT